METIGILLAGGLSRRFGSPKAFASIDEKFFYELVYNALDSVCDHVVIVSRKELLSRFPEELDVITDFPSVSGMGPLAGIYTAMSERPAAQYLVMPCDMPFIRPKETAALIQWSDGRYDVTAVRSKEDYIPLFSIWNGRVKEKLQLELANKQLSVMVFLYKLETEWLESGLIHSDKNVFRNINTLD